jgi:hypothetical protein
MRMKYFVDVLEGILEREPENVFLSKGRPLSGSFLPAPDPDPIPLPVPGMAMDGGLGRGCQTLAALTRKAAPLPGIPQRLAPVVV